MGDGKPLVLHRLSSDGRRRRILALKLDHRGDFIIALPAMRRLREDFPGDEITLVCGSWNRTFAESTGLFDHVACYDFFPENVRVWKGGSHNPVIGFDRAAAGRFDIAVDFRVLEDARFLLSRVDAGLRCGLGSVVAAPYLDIALLLPGAYDTVGSRDLAIPAMKFMTRVPGSDPFHYVTDFSVTDTHVFWGPYISLPAGEYDVTFHFHASGLDGQEIASRIEFDIACNAKRVAAARLDKSPREILREGRLTLHFSHTDPDSTIEFRTYTSGKPFAGVLHFTGVTVAAAGGTDPLPERPHGLHMGEQLLLLEELVHMRINGPVYPARLREGSALPAAAQEALAAAAAPGGLVCISPFSGDAAKDWPLQSYVGLVRLILERLDCAVALVGSPEQQKALQKILDAAGGDRRGTNLAGLTPWNALPNLFARCDLVVSNDSGVAHYAAACGAKLLTLFSANHAAEEWAPRGRDVTLLIYDLAKPTGRSGGTSDSSQRRGGTAPITPEIVFDWVAQGMGRAAKAPNAREAEVMKGDVT
jgi:ADP-heptose:LPS heptosyltransferase